MTSEYITIPPGLLDFWGGVQPNATSRSNDAAETFDAQQVAIGRARRALSVSIGGLGRTRETGLETKANAFPILGTRRSSATDETAVDPRNSTSTRRPQRSATISMGTLARSNVTSRRTSFDSSLRPPSAEMPGVRRPQPVAAPNQASQNAHVFQSLNNYRFPDSTDDMTRPLPIFIGSNYVPEETQGRRRNSSGARSWVPGLDLIHRASIAVESISSAVHHSSLSDVYEKAKVRQAQLRRSTIAQVGFQYMFYLLILATIYFLMVGVPLWNGVVYCIYILFNSKLAISAGTAVFLGVGFLYAYLPLLLPFEKTAPERTPFKAADHGKVNDTALLIPCYKSENLIGATLEAALKIFPAESIFVGGSPTVIANGNSPTPLDGTASVCERYGVSHTWSPLGSKIIAQFVGCFVARDFPYVLLIDDDCLLPPNFPIVSERLVGDVKCIGYTIKSVGPNRTRGTLCQQAQDIEYKISGVQRAFAGKLGSATFPHGAISIWDRELLVRTFEEHPGFSVSEDWFFGHVARQLGSRIQMCTSVFVETETPSAVFFGSGGARGGFGEMTVWKQRFYRWNFFFVNGIYYDMSYILFSWKLGWWEIGTKLFVFQEVYETLLYLLAPFVLPISFYVRPRFTAYMFVATLGLYMINVLIFNYVHLRSRGQAVTALCLLYYMPYKTVLTFVNIASCYYSIYKYAKYFAKRHPKVIEDEKAVGIVLKLEEEAASRPGSSRKSQAVKSKREGSNVRRRRFTVTAMGTPGAVLEDPQPDLDGTGVGVHDFAAQRAPTHSATTSVMDTIITDLQSSSSFKSRWSSASASPDLAMGSIRRTSMNDG